MSTFESSKRVASAVKEINGVKENNKNISYDDFAVEIKVIAMKYGLSVDFVRKVSGHEFNNISKVIKAYQNGRTERFKELYQKLGEVDKGRVELALEGLKDGVNVGV